MLRLTEVTKGYAKGVKALNGVSLDVPKGMFGLLGPNGAGKSTLMRTIATLQTPDSGTITFDGIDVLRDKTELRRLLGYLPQEFGSYPRTSAQAMLRHLAALKGLHGATQREAVEQLLVRTNLWEARKRSVHTFSGGMKQRFGIAQALLGDPKLLIVDEPTAGLDPAERRRILAEWRLRRRLGKPLNLARLAKAAFTFEGAGRYAAWKIERHTGLQVPMTPWRERHVILASPGVFWRLWRARRKRA